MREWCGVCVGDLYKYWYASAFFAMIVSVVARLSVINCKSLGISIVSLSNGCMFDVCMLYFSIGAYESFLGRSFPEIRELFSSLGELP